MTFDNKKILQSYPWKHHEKSSDNFWAIFDDYLECQIDFSKFFSEKKSNFKSLQTHRSFDTHLKLI